VSLASLVKNFSLAICLFRHFKPSFGGGWWRKRLYAMLWECNSMSTGNLGSRISLLIRKCQGRFNFPIWCSGLLQIFWGFYQLELTIRIGCVGGLVSMSRIQVLQQSHHPWYVHHPWLYKLCVIKELSNLFIIYQSPYVSMQHEVNDLSSLLLIFIRWPLFQIGNFVWIHWGQ